MITSGANNMGGVGGKKSIYQVTIAQLKKKSLLNQTEEWIGRSDSKHLPTFSLLPKIISISVLQTNEKFKVL